MSKNTNLKDFAKGTVLKERYEIHTLIGRGGMAATYKAFDKEGGRIVAIKILDFQELKEWKELELFEREIKTLMKIDHPQIPDYVDHFKTEVDSKQYYALVQEFVEGNNLKKIILNTSELSYTNIIKITKELLVILKYMHNCKPPIIHRDLNPKNIIVNENNTVYLVDFGAVSLKIKNTKTASRSDTFVGTLGYMPPEQLYGKATPAVDLYALGATILFMLSGKEPQDFPLRKMKLNYKKVITKRTPILELVDKLIEPDDKLRINNTDHALSLYKKIEAEINKEVSKSQRYKTEIENRSDEGISDKWIEQELNKEKLENEEHKRISEVKNERAQSRKEQKKERNRLKQEKISNRFPNRIKLVKYKDGEELVIKTHAFWHLLWRRKWSALGSFSTLSGVGMVFWFFFWEWLQNEIKKSFLEIPVFILPLDILIIPATLLIGYIIWSFIINILMRLRIPAIKIRITAGGHVIVYKRNPRKPVFLGEKSDIRFEIKEKGKNNIGALGNPSEFWFDLKCLSEKKVIFQRKSIPVKGKGAVKKFIKKYLNNRVEEK